MALKEYYNFVQVSNFPPSDLMHLCYSVVSQRVHACVRMQIATCCFETKIKDLFFTENKYNILFTKYSTAQKLVTSRISFPARKAAA